MITESILLSVIRLLLAGITAVCLIISFVMAILMVVLLAMTLL